MDQPIKGQQAMPESDPKLKMAAMEIKAILDKYDVAGVVTLHTPSHLEFLVKIDPSYSVVSLNETRKLRITPPIEIPGQEAEAKARVAKTVNMLFNLRNQVTQVMMTLGQAENSVRKHFGIKPPARPSAPVIPNPFINGKNGGNK